MEWGTQYPIAVSSAEPHPLCPLLNAHKQESQEYTWELTKEMEDQRKSCPGPGRKGTLHLDDVQHWQRAKGTQEGEGS